MLELKIKKLRLKTLQLI